MLPSMLCCWGGGPSGPDRGRSVGAKGLVERVDAWGVSTSRLSARNGRAAASVTDMIFVSFCTAGRWGRRGKNPGFHTDDLDVRLPSGSCVFYCPLPHSQRPVHKALPSLHFQMCTPRPPHRHTHTHTHTRAYRRHPHTGGRHTPRACYTATLPAYYKRMYRLINSHSTSNRKHKEIAITRQSQSTEDQQPGNNTAACCVLVPLAPSPKRDTLTLTLTLTSSPGFQQAFAHTAPHLLHSCVA